MLIRCSVLKFILGGVIVFFLLGHAPYRQWVVYRSERLMIVASKSEADAFPLAKAVTRDLKQFIPKAKPEATRAPTIRRITQLILSKQIQVAVLSTEQAQLMFQGKGEGSIEGPVPLRVVAHLNEPYILVSHAEFDKDKAYLMLFGLFDGNGSQTLSPQYKTPISAMKRAKEIGIPLHVGAQEYLFPR